MLHYASLISAIFILGLYASLVVNRKWLIKTGLGIALVFTIVWWNVDYSVQNWSTEGESDEWTLRYKDYVRRGSSRPYYREFSMTKRDSYLVTYKSEGAMTETGKQHGKWMWHSFDWDAASGSDSRFDSGNDFYWYGDKITEGEWHLREK